jgi:twinkle protein
MSLDGLRNAGVVLKHYRPGNHKTTCPQCSHARRNKSDPCLSVTIDAKGAVVKCHHCDWTEAFNDERDDSPFPVRHKPAPIRPSYQPKPETVDERVRKWFAGRGISEATLNANRISVTTAWMPGPNAEVSCVAFPYYRDGELVNVKYRDGQKHFRQEKGAEKILFGMDTVPPEAETLIWVEGEMDVLACHEAGVWNVVSVPDGAPKKVRDEDVDPEDDAKFEYVWNCRTFLDRFQRHILAVDNDGPGKALEEELARRIGKVDCWRVTWPVLAGDVTCKDANDTLIHGGPEAVRDALSAARPYPIQSLFEAGQFETEAVALYRGGRKRGLSTGFSNVDRFYTVRPGELCIVTGYPSSGKSEFVDATAVNLAMEHKWRFAVCSFENPPDEHIAKWAEKYLGRPFNDGPTQRMSERELLMAIRWMEQHFFFIRAEEESPTIDWVLDRAKAAVRRYGINGLILDPYNEFEHKRPNNVTETEYVSQMLAKVKRFAQSHDVHVWFVAHPAKPPKDRQDDPPSLYDISGSANWVNKADVGISVHRGWLDDGSRDSRTQVHVKKVRFKAVGEPGIATLEYMPACGGRYREVG